MLGHAACSRGSRRKLLSITHGFRTMGAAALRRHAGRAEERRYCTLLVGGWWWRGVVGVGWNMRSKVKATYSGEG